MSRILNDRMECYTKAINLCSKLNLNFHYHLIPMRVHREIKGYVVLSEDFDEVKGRFTY